MFKAGKAIMREIHEYEDDDSLKFTIDVENNDDLSKIKVILSPPEDTPYEEGIFFLILKIPNNYPDQPPDVKFETKIYHPCVYENGDFCYEFQRENWMPFYKLKDVIDKVYDSLKNPDSDYFVNTDIKEQYYNDHAAFERTARQWTRDYACD